jgi:DNA-binding MarR family transcriptional regulator
MSTIDSEALPETDDLSPSEQAALERITAEGEVPQSELWKALDLSSRGGSRIAKSLTEKGLVERKKTTHEGRVTYLLTPIESDRPTSTETSAENGAERRSSTAAETHDQTPTMRDAAGGEDHSRSAREQRALELIKREGDLPQSELWKALDLTSRTGSRVATALEEQELIERKQTVYEGQRTYLLSPRRDPADLDFSLLIAGNRLSPLIGEDTVDPIASDAFTQWLLQLAANEDGRPRN